MDGCAGLLPDCVYVVRMVAVAVRNQNSKQIHVSLPDVLHDSFTKTAGIHQQGSLRAFVMQ